MLSESTATGEVLVLSNNSPGWMQSSRAMGLDMMSEAHAASLRVDAVTTGDFVNTWNTATSNYVIVHTHGAPDKITGEGLYFEADRIEELENNENIKLLMITACSVGGSNGNQANFGQLISQKIAPDGIVICSSTDVRGNDKRCYPESGGVWLVYQNGVLVDVLLQRKITMGDAVEYWSKHYG